LVNIDFTASAPRLSASHSRARRIVARAMAIAVFAAFLAYYGLLCFRHQGWGGDFQMYCAGASQLYRDFAHPAHEAINVPGTESTVYTLQLVAVAALGKLFGATPYRALEFAGVFNLIVFSCAIGYFFSRQSVHSRWELPAACFLFVNLFLRWLHFGWSSDTSLTSMQYVQSYPSTLAWALAFVAFGLMRDVARERRLAKVAVLAAVLWALLLTHVLTASWVIGIVGLHGLLQSVERRSAVPLAAAVATTAVAVVLALSWPYSPFLGQGSLSGVNEGSTFGKSPFIDFPDLYAVAMPACAYLLLRLRRHGFWLLGLVATLAALALWRSLHISFGNRYAFFAAFFAQFLVAEVMALGIFALVGPLSELSPTRAFSWLDRPLSIIVLAAACVAWLPSPMIERAGKVPELGSLLSPAALLELSSPEDAYYRQFADLRPYLARGDVVLTPVSRAVFDLASVTGAQVVSAPNALRVPDRIERGRDVSKFFERVTTRTERAEIVHRYGVTKIRVPEGDNLLLAALTELFGEPVYRDHACAILSTAEGGGG
jgi:hypothetical protein